MIRFHYLFQTNQFVFGLVFYTLTVMAIGGQIALRDYFGDVGCKIYALSFLAIAGWFVYGGLGVAIYRILCLRDQTMTEMMRKSIVKKIQILQVLLLIIGFLPILHAMTTYDTWEVLAMYRVCIDENLVLTDIRASYQNRESLINLPWLVRASFLFAGALAQSGTIIEFGIFAKIIYDLWHHDKEYLLNGTITRNMAQNRRRKNMISLRGQVACFLFETCCLSTYLIGFVVNFEDSSSLNPVITILSQSLVSIAQFFASHELQRFVKEKFEWVSFNKVDVSRWECSSLSKSL